MNYSNVRLILAREIRDQLRDRRTLFMIAVLPILLYPLMGVSLLQVSQFMQEHKARVLVLGAPELEGLPPLFEGERFASPLFADSARARLLELHFAAEGTRAEAERQVREGRFEAAIVFPSDFAARLESFREAIRRPDRPANGATGLDANTPRLQSGGVSRNTVSQNTAAKAPPLQWVGASRRLEVPSPEILYNAASDKSQIAFVRVSEILHRWTQRIGDDNLARSGLPTVAARPFLVQCADVADADQREASMWSKVLPILLLIWVLTGAFYPAIDLCAGEKERGTLETLLSSPAGRGEIAVGKLAAIMLFSIVTALLNLASLGLTGWMVASQLPGFGLPPFAALSAVGIVLLPIAALFSALCLALAAFARSTKEGQYYLMPVLLITLPLVVLPMSPGVELNLGNSLIPVTGIVLLLRSALEGDYWRAVQYAPAVTMVTMLACVLSIRWAIDQFNSESVLFRASERFEVGLWLRRLFRRRGLTPSLGAAVWCGAIILLANFFLSLAQTMPSDFGGFARTVMLTQLGAIAAPALLLALLTARSPRETFLLKRPVRWAAVPLAVLLAVALHPAAHLIQAAVQRLYPVSDSVLPAFQKIQKLFHDADFWPLVLVIAIVPAVCEELAFRGFILTGFRRMGRPWRAILLSAILFGISHGILQQSLIASLLGVLLGYVAMQSGSLLPGVAFHAVHNGLLMANGRIAPEMIPVGTWMDRFAAPLEGGGCTFHWPAALVGLAAAALVLYWFGRLARPPLPEQPAEDFLEIGLDETYPKPVLCAVARKPR